MKYNFDQEIDRKGTDSVKWEYILDDQKISGISHTNRFFGDDRTLPLWVADMDFPVPQPVIEALKKRADRGIFGYTLPGEEYFQAVTGWMKKRHHWKISPDWIVTTSGVVPAINMLVRTLIAPGEKVLIQPPVYYPFFSAVENNQGTLVFNPLKFENGKYSIDFADLEEKAKDPLVKMAILCSPHNPVGRVWTREELTRFGEICLKNDILVISDEIHGDLIYQGIKFTPFASISQEFAQNSITCTAASKTFNLAGLHTSNIIIPDPEIRKKFNHTIKSLGLGGSNPMGIVAQTAAYTHGEEWLEQVLGYIEENLAYLTEFFTKNLPQIKVIKPEGTYLVWLDFRELGLEKKSLKKLMVDQAKIYLDDGYLFGKEGEGFERINIACPRSILVEALERIKHAVEAL